MSLEKDCFGHVFLSRFKFSTLSGPEFFDQPTARGGMNHPLYQKVDPFELGS